jgi:hypothetical protein
MMTITSKGLIASPIVPSRLIIRMSISSILGAAATSSSTEARQHILSWLLDKKVIICNLRGRLAMLVVHQDLTFRPGGLIIIHEAVVINFVVHVDVGVVMVLITTIGVLPMRTSEPGATSMI